MKLKKITNKVKTKLKEREISIVMRQLQCCLAISCLFHRRFEQECTLFKNVLKNTGTLIDFLDEFYHPLRFIPQVLKHLVKTALYQIHIHIQFKT